MTTSPCTALDLWTMAQTAWGEARGEGVAGLSAVLQVMRNRQRLHRTWQGKSIQAICQAKWQFSCWNATDPNRAKVEAVGMEDATFRLALQLAIPILVDLAADPTHGATHYYAIQSPRPRWAIGKVPSATIGHHVFFAGIA
jgi:spore germination cell wall hydrolase CwlJ-like protein